jgi:hypothetical protein
MVKAPFMLEKQYAFGRVVALAVWCVSGRFWRKSQWIKLPRKLSPSVAELEQAQ